MKTIAFRPIVAALIIGLSGIASAAVINGNLYTEFYSYETRVPDTVSHLRSLQGIRLNGSDLLIPGLSAYFNSRVASDISNQLSTDPDYRVFGAYLQYKDASNKFQLRGGRQFVYEGIQGFLMDGGRLKVGLGNKADITGFGGVIPGPSFFEYKYVNKWDQRNAFGGRLHYTPQRHYALNVSFLQREVEGNLDARLLGADAAIRKGNYSNYVRADYDLIFRRLKLLSIRPQFKLKSGHSLRLEYSFRKPSVGYSSIFSVVKANTIHQIRASGVYKHNGNTRMLGGIVYTKYSDDSHFSFRGGVSYKGQTGGLVWASGYGGSKIGVFGGLRHELNDKASVYANLDMYNLKLDTDEDEQEMSLAAALGGGYKLMAKLAVRAEVQILTNPVYDYDTRAYLRLDYSIQNMVIGGGEK